MAGTGEEPEESFNVATLTGVDPEESAVDDGDGPAEPTERDALSDDDDDPGRDYVDLSRFETWARRQDPARCVLIAMCVGWALLFIVLGAVRHNRFATFSFDLGTYDQGVWLLSRFRMFDTIRGLPLLGHHMNPILLLLAPFYWFGAGPIFLLTVQVAAQASGAVAIFLLARDRLKDRWLAVALAGVLLLNPTYQYLTWEFFHPDALAIAPLLFAYWAATARRWRWFAVAAVLAVACKEDVALPMAVIGVLIYLRLDRRIGLITVAVSAGWYLLSTRLLMPLLLDGARPFYDTFFGDFGNSAGSVVKNVITRPSKAIDLATTKDRVSYYRMMFLPVAFVPFAAPGTLMIAVPMLAVNVLTTFPYAREIRYHYAALVLAGIMLATVEGVARMGAKPGFRRFLVGLIAATSLATTVAWGPSPISTKYHSGLWPLAEDSRNEIKRRAVDLVPAGDSVAAIYYMGPHLTHRTHVYDFPEPWKRVNWGLDGSDLHDPTTVEWIVVDKRLFSDFDRLLIDDLLAGEFTTRLDEDDILVAERTDRVGSAAS